MNLLNPISLILFSFPAKLWIWDLFLILTNFLQKWHNPVILKPLFCTFWLFPFPFLFGNLKFIISIALLCSFQLGLDWTLKFALSILLRLILILPEHRLKLAHLYFVYPFECWCDFELIKKECESWFNTWLTKNLSEAWIFLSINLVLHLYCPIFCS